MGVSGDALRKAGEVLYARGAEELAAPPQLLVEALQHADAEFALAFDGDDPRVRQPAGGVAFELDALFEVDQIELHLVGTVVQRQIGDQRVQQGRFAGARLAGDDRVLRRTDAQPQRLQLLGAGAADGHDQFAAAVVGPQLVRRGGDQGERHFDAAGLARLLSGRAEHVAELVALRRRIDRQRQLLEQRVVPREAVVGPLEVDGAVEQLVKAELVRQAKLLVDAHERVHAAPRPGIGNRDELVRRRVAEPCREIRRHDQVVRLGHLAGALVVLVNRGELIAEIFLQHLLHVLRDERQPLVDLFRIGPNAAGDKLLVVIGQVHEGGKVLTQPRGIEDGEPELSRGHRGEEAQHRQLQHLDRRTPAGALSGDHQARLLGERHGRGQHQAVHAWVKPLVLGHRILDRLQRQRIFAESDGLGRLGGPLELPPRVAGPIGKQLAAARLHAVELSGNLAEAAQPCVGHVLPRRVVLLVSLGAARVETLGIFLIAALLGGEILIEQRRVLGLGGGERAISLSRKGSAALLKLRLDRRHFGVVRRLSLGDVVLSALLDREQIAIAAAGDLLRQAIAGGPRVGRGGPFVLARLVDLPLDATPLGQRLPLAARHKDRQQRRAADQAADRADDPTQQRKVHRRGDHRRLHERDAGEPDPVTPAFVEQRGDALVLHH